MSAKQCCLLLAVLLIGTLIAQQSSPRNDFLEHGWAFDLPTAASAVPAKLGTPLSTKQTTEKNRHDPSQTNQRTIFQYPGLMLEYLHAGTADFITKIEIRPAMWPLRFNLNVLQPSYRVVASLGKATSTKPNQACYQSDGAGYDEVCFTFEQGKISSIRWSNEPD